MVSADDSNGLSLNQYRENAFFYMEGAVHSVDINDLNTNMLA